MNNTNQINQSVIENYCVDVEKENDLLKAKLGKAQKELLQLRSEKLYREKDLEHYKNLVKIKDDTIKQYNQALFNQIKK
tara:strand:- start:7428 stop:7664 length:237 start_codon:yes stop_codon:yes gene_type:complete